MEALPNIMHNALPIVGVVIGASLQYLFSRFSEKEKHQQNLKTLAYVDFLRGAAGMAITQKNNDKDKEQKFSILMVDAKARIAVYGSKKVVEAIANFWRSGANTGTPKGKRLFINICQVMREESSQPDQYVLEKEISQLLLGEDI